MLVSNLVRRFALAGSIVLSFVAGQLAADEAAVAASPPKKELRLPETPANYADPRLPAYFVEAGVPIFDTTPESNPITDAGATLGRALFYDVRLSGSGTIACASCHLQKHAFADPRQVSVGFHGQSTDRNAMTLTDLRYVRAGFFWDEREATLEEAALAPMYSHVEMGMTPETTLAAIAADDRYDALFENAFGTSEASEELVARAVSQFIRSIVSTNSKYDEGMEQVAKSTDDFPNFAAAENLGKTVFFANCIACHTLGQGDKKAVFATFRALNNGIDGDADARDGGLADVTFNPTDLGQFKPSSLRNIEYSGPYMHDGRFATLKEVVDHYSEGVKRHPNVSAVVRMNLTLEEKAGLVAFLKTLSDPKLIADPKFSDPWVVVEESAETPGSTKADAGATTEDSIERTELDRKLAAGVGLSAAETLVWIESLDADDDGSLSIAELEPLVARIASDETAARLREPTVDGETVRRGRRRVGATETESTEAIPAEADLDGNGETSDSETQNYAALLRFFELGDGNRLNVMLDRRLGAFDVDESTRAAMRAIVSRAKLNVNAERRRSNAAALTELRQVIGDEKMERLGTAVVAAVSADGPIPTDARDQRQEAARKIGSFDRDSDGKLSTDERAPLVEQIQSFPGGLGRRAPAAPDIFSFADRILKFDVDGSGGVTAEELPERMIPYAKGGDVDGDGALTLEEARSHFTKAAFDGICVEGIYIGGAFDDALLFHRERLREIGLDADALEQANAILVEHERRLRDVSASEFARCLTELREQLQHAADRNPSDQVSK